MEKITVAPYAPNLVEATRAIGYSFEAAIADIMDNSIAKGASEINVYFDSNYPNQHIAILDDACGMSSAELINAMRYGSRNANEQREITDLGRFGLGMKTASLSQCRKLTVITKKDGEISAACWDLDYINVQKDWSLQVLEENEIEANIFYKILSKQKHGTAVIWENFDRLLKESNSPAKVFDEKMSLTKEHVALVFHRFMDRNEAVSNRLKIYFNKDKIEPIDPFLLDNPGTQPLEETRLNLEGGQIIVKPYVLPHATKLRTKDKKNLGDIAELRTKQGFYVYRNKRLIIWGTWFRLIKQHELNKLARVRVDIPNTLDFIWEIDVKKSTASLPDTIKKSLVNIVDNAVGRSVRVFSYRGHRKNTDTPLSVWNCIEDRGTYRYEINKDLPIVKHIFDALPESEENYFDTFMKFIEAEFPYDSVYYHSAKTDSVAKPATREENEVYEMAANMLALFNGNTDMIKMFINSMHANPIFAQYPEIIARIREEYLNETE